MSIKQTMYDSDGSKSIYQSMLAAASHMVQVSQVQDAQLMSTYKSRNV